MRDGKPGESIWYIFDNSVGYTGNSGDTVSGPCHYRTKGCGPYRIGEHDVNHGHRDDCNTGADVGGGVSGGYLSHLCNDQFPGGYCADEGIYGSLHGKPQDGEEKRK